MKGFRCIRRLLTTLTLLAAVAALPGCMLLPHHGHDADARTEQPADAHEGHGAEASAPAPHDTAVAGKAHHHGYEAMPMMHGSGPWKWLVGGAMVVMMAFMIL